MKKNYLIKSLSIAVLLLAFWAPGNSGLKAQTATTITFTYTGSQQSFTVPSCVSTITIDARGAQGAQANDNAPLNSTGGLGGRAIGIIPVVSGQVLYINVGGVGNINGSGGFNGGGAGGISTAGSSCFGGPAGGGGGASDIRTAGTALSNRVIVAGGGGGSGRDYCNGSCQPCGCGGSGGGGGGVTGVVGVAAGNCGFGYPGLGVNGGGGGTGSAAGAGAPGDNGGNAGTAGALGVGGGGGAGTLDVAGGGGGGGYYGGGGGGSASSGSGVGGGGGGGGSSYLGSLTNTSTASSFQSGAGVIILSYNFNGAGVLASATSNSICSGTTVTLTATNVISYTWTPGGSNATTQVVSPTSNTSYTVQGTNTLGCISTAIISVSVDPGLPVLTVANTASATGGICPTKTVVLTASGATSHNWTGGITNGVVFSPSTSFTYVVTGANACGSTTAATSVSVHPLPTVTGVPSQPTICSGNPVTLTGIGNATNYVWNGSTANGINWFPSVTTTYTVVGTSIQSCTNVANTTVTVVTTPVAPPLASPPLICIGSSATLSSNGATNYTWTTPSGNFNTSSISVSPVVSTTYVLTKANANCVNTQTVGVIVNLLPSVFAIVTPTLICAAQTATLQGAGASTYSWSTAGPPPLTFTGTQVFVSPSVPTLYTLTASDGTCVNSTTVALAVNPNPTITININPANFQICRGQSATLTAGGAISYSWVAGGVTSNTNSATIIESPVNSTLYQVIGENTFSCVTGAQQVVVVNNTPTLSINLNKPLVCANAPANLTVTANQQPPTTYQWDANANNATTSITTVNPPVTTIYTVTGTYVSTQCSSTKTIQVTVFLPTFAVNSPTSSCLGGSITLIASGANTYTWSGNQPFSQITVSPPTATVYQVAATSVSAGVSCVSTNSVVVSIYSNPTITAIPQRTMICKGEVTNLLGSGGSTYIWSTTQTGSAVPVNPNVNTTYTVEGTDQNGCKGTASTQLKVSTCAGINANAGSQEMGLSIFPNPNSGQFTIKTNLNAELKIISELGQVLRTISLTTLNNHQVNIADLPMGIYFITSEDKKVNEKIVVGN